MDDTIKKMEDRLDASVDKLNNTMNGITDQLVKMDKRVSILEETRARNKRQ